jgi:hypothetical protein
VARKDYVWDAEAAKAIEQQELDEHFDQHRNHYVGLARLVWTSLETVSDDASYLKAGDLTDALQPLIDHDSVTLTGMRERGLPEPHARLGPQWHSWFTQYIVERFVAELEGGTG